MTVHPFDPERLFPDLAAIAETFEVFGVHVVVASLRNILRSKEAADRPQDRQDALVIREMLRRGAGKAR